MDSQSSHQNITFLFTDVEGNTGLWSKFPEKMAAVLRRHDELIETIAERHDGQVVRPRGEGDSRFIVFTYPLNALNAVVAAGEIQKALYDEPWPIPVPLRVRIALHTGDATQIDKDYYGPDVNRCAGIRAVACGGQTLLSAKTAQFVQVNLPPNLQLRNLHYHYLKGESQPQQIFQLVIPGIPNEFLPLKKQPLPDLVKKHQSAEQRKRQALIENVQHGWIDGVLNRSLQQSIMLNLRITLAPDATSPSTPAEHRLVADAHSPAYLTQTAITEIYEQADHQLLILGAPGSGKTTVLMLLTSMLLGEAERNDAAPIPIILNLSSWAAKRNHLALWLVEELERQFRVPKAIGRVWVQNQQVIPLLDGLDEVAFAHRADCVAAINAYQRMHSTNGLVVCCRSGEYAALQTPLTLGAIEVEPLTFAEIENYFKQLGARFGELVKRLQQDSALRELITSPLLVSILTVVQADLPQAVSDMTIDAYRAMLFKTYIEHALRPTARRRPSTEDEPFASRHQGHTRWRKCNSG
ncbi:MAG: adenylate/guanylate cyclase domain-containing protein [Caldilineaceae bacterium]